MKLIKHGNCMRFVCENCGCEWNAVKKECEESPCFENLPRYIYKCPECGKPTFGKKIEAPEYIKGSNE